MLKLLPHWEHIKSPYELFLSVDFSSWQPREAFICISLEGRNRDGIAFLTRERVFFRPPLLLIWLAAKCISQMRARLGRKFNFPETQITSFHFSRNSGLVLGMVKNWSLQFFLLFLHTGTTHFLSSPLMSNLRGGAGTVIVNLRYSLEGLNGSDEGSLTREYSRLSILVPIVNSPRNDRC